ncbi:MAG: diguanylate cyclase [Deltaproteobacteria bacterium]|nr:diguanylate cyclase [Deltaproteobacteria bacterium]
MSGFHVLLVDDSPTALGMLSYWLSAAGYEVETATDGLDALKSGFRRVPDLVLMDIRMPRMDGIQACRLFKADHSTRDVPVILLSSQEVGSERIHATRAGADRFLLKDVGPDEIVRSLEECIAGRSPRPSPPPGDREETPVPEDIEILTRVNQILETKLFEATLFNEIGRVGREVDDFETTIREVDRILSEIVPHDAMAAVFSDGLSLETVILYTYAPGEEIRRLTREATVRLHEEAQVPAAPGRTHVLEFLLDGKRQGGEPAAERFRPWIVCPIRSGDVVKGLLALFSDKGTAGVGEERLTAVLLRHSFVVMENAWLYRQIARMSATDGLTGLTNHLHFVEGLQKEHARSSRYRHPYSVLMVDIDHFKKVNDVYGHPVGDIVLREVSAILSEQCRNTDLPARYGGEEFIVLLPATAIGEARIVAERIRQAVERKMFASPSPLVRMTVSIGISAYDPESPLGHREILKHADEALYSAKREGRNRVCLR